MNQPASYNAYTMNRILSPTITCLLGAVNIFVTTPKMGKIKMPTLKQWPGEAALQVI